METGEIKGHETLSSISPFECFKQSEAVLPRSVNLLGFPFDGTACFRKGTVKGPQAIREISYGIESFSPYLDADLEDFDFFYDLGDLNLSESSEEEKRWQQGVENFEKLASPDEIRNKRISFLMIGGEHSVSYAPIKSYLKAYPNLVLLHLDAHADLRDGYEGYHYSHASVIRRALDHFGPEHDLIQYGIRSGTREEYKWMRDNGTQCLSLNNFLERVEMIDSNRPVYLTLDLDYFDPSYFPGTGTPEPGGENFHSFVKLMKILRNKNLVACDAVELSPDLDSSGNSSVFAAKVVRELALVLALTKTNFLNC